MGQTQLLMIVLAVIIVGIAVAVGISQLGESALAGNRDAVALDCQTVISKAQGWYRKPVSLGGGGNSITGFTLQKTGVDSTNANGTISVVTASSGTFTVKCTGNEDVTPGTKVFVQLAYTTSNDSTAYTDNM